ncbi:hypothetical protein HanXRQr2_Chr11g0510111 [Helianthus annuus]|uniref:Uncharacterized protein n=2 Tax=Helianthus annuus TaxID=4232 RepID=A0A9K3HRV2_HELAN|nr:hypothetical protein HanXRQr2_Chr11g0510111 [Helianthus annuus]KAJ0502908.1 hypothetical protein HanHA300_Chr11g0418301 [Helianthus annuus]KAJ0518873.1 hypothetical protein HanHA89_Chr11g0442331 [Helianthus annuus]
MMKVSLKNLMRVRMKTWVRLRRMNSMMLTPFQRVAQTLQKADSMTRRRPSRLHYLQKTPVVLEP